MEPNTVVDSVPSIENILKVDELSEDEFKTKIIKWFKDRGLLSNMRTYMRYQMITYLKETQIGSALAEKSMHQPILPKERTIHFLVAEYLLHNQYYYSLSILVSEVTFLNVFPDMTSIKKSNTSLTKSHEVGFRFDKNDIMEFIQSLGIFKNSLEAEQICKFYLKNSNYSLLTIVLRVLIERTVITSDSSSKSLDLETIDENETIYNKWNNVVFTLLKKSLLKNSNIYFIRDNIVKFFLNEFDKFQINTETKQKIEFDKMKDEIENEFECKEMNLKESLLEMEQKFNKEMSFYINTLTTKDEVIGKLRRELKKFETFNENFQKLKQKYTKEEESKKRYKETAQLLKHECLKLQEQLMVSKEQTSKKDSEILCLKENIRKMQEDFDSKSKKHDVEINDLKLTNVRLKNELDQEKTSAILTQVKHQEEISKNNSLLAEINELKAKNQTLENYLSELNKRSDELNRQFQNTMKSIQTVDQQKMFDNEILHNKNSSIKLNEKTLSDSDLGSPATSIIDILNEAKHRLDNLQVETQLVEENYDKHYNIQTPVRYADLWRTTRIVVNQDIPVHITDKVETVNDHTSTDFIKKKNTSTHDMKVGTENESEQIPKAPQFGVSKLPPLFDELHKNILSSFHNFQSTVLEVSNDLNTFVQSTSKLSDNLIKPKSDNLQPEHKINIKAKELESSLLELNDVENDILNDFISKIDTLSNQEWCRSENEETLPKIPSVQTNNSKIDDLSLNNDWFFRLENEKTSLVSSSVQTFNSMNSNVSRSIQTQNDSNLVKSDDQLNNKSKQNEEFKLGVYETNSMEFIYEQGQEDNHLGNYCINGVQSQLETIQETENMENNKIETENNNEVKEAESEYVIEQLEISSLSSQCDADIIGDQNKNYPSTRNICPSHLEIDQVINSKECNYTEYSCINESTSSKHDLDSINSQLKEEINDTNSNSLQNIIETLVNKVYSSTEDIVTLIDDKGTKQQEKEQLVHILDQISIEDIPNTKSSNSNSLNSPISTGFDNKNDDFWM